MNFTGNVRPADMERITTPALAQAYIEEQIKELRTQIGDKKVLLALSGGVDSSVVAALLIKAVGKQLVSVHVNHGLLRKGEPEQVVRVFRDELNANLVYVDATDRFLNKLAGVADPEQKRKIIGAEFIRVFEEEARKLEGRIDDMLIEEAVESRHHLTCDFIETRGVDPQEELRTGHLQVVEERRLQRRIVGRARIDQQTLSLSVITNRSHEGRYLYKIRPGTGQDTNSLLHLLTYFCAKIRN